MLGLPDGIKACLFDLDGVLTQTAKVHAKAWKEMFDGFLETQDGQKPFDAHADYDEYVDGKPREDGVRDFLKSRGIEADEKLVDELATKKNDIVQNVIERDGVEPYEGSVRYLEAARGRRAAARGRLLQPQLRGGAEGGGHRPPARGARRRRHRGRAAPRRQARARHVPRGRQGRRASRPAEAAVFEDALVGVEAGHAGKFGHVVGVDRVGQRDALREHGADVVVDDLDELLG